MDNKSNTGKGPNVYLAPPIEKTDELDALQKAVYLFSCHRKITEVSSKILRKKLILLMALYIKYDYSRETKEKAAKILSVKKTDINAMNLELRNNNYLVKDKMNTRINHLHPDLELLKDYVLSVGDEPMILVFRIQ